MRDKKPIIGILTNIFTIEEGQFAGMERIYVNREYVKTILKAGGIPVMLPIIEDLETICKQIENIDGLLLSGGQDLHPHHYNEEPSPKIGTICLERDRYEIAAVRHASSLNIPIFGVCRGLQLLNVVFGGSLHQDIPGHSQKMKREEAFHTIEIVPGTKMHKIFGAEKVKTNSFHHQAVKHLAPGFRATACANDGTIEGIERIEGSFVMGVQWHPEMMVNLHPEMQKLFDAFVAEARQ